MKKMLAAIALAAALTACAGMQPNQAYPQMTFTVPANYQEAFRRADQQSRECPSNIELDRSGHVYTDNESAILRIAMPHTAHGDLMRVNIQSQETGSRVVITTIDRGVFDSHAAEAMRKSIESGKVVCRQYQRAG